MTSPCKPPVDREERKPARPADVRPDLERLRTTVENFCVWIESLSERDLRAQDWGPREVLAHLVYWHEWYVAQSEAVLAGRALRLPSGRFADMNSEAARKFRNTRPSALTRRFRAVNRRLTRLAEAHDPRKIAFQIKEGSKRWRLSDLIPAAEAHIRNHLRALKKHPKPHDPLGLLPAREPPDRNPPCRTFPEIRNRHPALLFDAACRMDV